MATEPRIDWGDLFLKLGITLGGFAIIKALWPKQPSKEAMERQFAFMEIWPFYEKALASNLVSDWMVVQQMATQRNFPQMANQAAARIRQMNMPVPPGY